MKAIRPCVKPAAAMLAFAVLLSVSRHTAAQEYLPAQDFFPCTDCTNAGRGTITNLYWHEPGASWKYGCNQVVASDYLGCQPTWYASAEVMPLFRDNGDEFTFATVGAGGPAALGTTSFGDDFQPGVRTVVGRSLGDLFRLEATYYGTYDWSGTAAVRNGDANGVGGTGNLFSPFTNAGMLNVNNNNLAQIGFSSKFDNLEINLRRRIALPPGPFEMSLLFGGRYMRVRESLQYHTESSVPGPQTTMNDVMVNTENNLLGLQIGFMAQFLIQPRLWVDLEGKGGIYTNDADQSTLFRHTDSAGNTTMSPGAAAQDVTSFAGDISLMLNWQVAPAFTFRIGYYVNWLTGLALAPNNFQNDVGILTTGPALLNHSGTQVYHGPVAGFVWAY